MTKYKLEDFRVWLEADQSRKEGLNWYNDSNYFLYWNQHPGYFEEKFIPAVEGNFSSGTYGGETYRLHRQVAKKWMAEIDQAEKQKKSDREQLQELYNLLFPNQSYDFDQLKQEIARFKCQELAPQVRNERVKFEQLITDAKNKTRGSEKIIDLLLETQKQVSQTADNSQKDKLSGKIEAYQSILEDNLTSEEIQNLLTKQTEFQQLEEQLSSLQISEQQTQIQVPPK